LITDFATSTQLTSTKNVAKRAPMLQAAAESNRRTASTRPGLCTQQACPRASEPVCCSGWHLTSVHGKPHYAMPVCLPFGPMPSSVKLEVHSISQRRQKRSKPRTQATCIKIWLSSRTVLPPNFWILCTPNVQVKKILWNVRISQTSGMLEPRRPYQQTNYVRKLLSQ